MLAPLGFLAQTSLSLSSAMASQAVPSLRQREEETQESERDFRVLMSRGEAGKSFVLECELRHRVSGVKSGF